MGEFQLAGRCCPLAIYSQFSEIAVDDPVTSPALIAPDGVRSARPAAIAALRALPRFAEAARAAAAGMVTHYQGNRLLNQLMNDRGRVLFTHHAVYLHFSRTPGDPGSGLTVSRMKDLCVETQLCSRGRVEVMLGLLRAAGYLAPASEPADRRRRVLVPTDKLLTLHRQRFQMHFAAMESVLPEASAGAPTSPFRAVSSAFTSVSDPMRALKSAARPLASPQAARATSRSGFHAGIRAHPRPSFPRRASPAEPRARAPAVCRAQCRHGDPVQPAAGRGGGRQLPAGAAGAGIDLGAGREIRRLAKARADAIARCRERRLPATNRGP